MEKIKIITLDSDELELIKPFEAEVYKYFDEENKRPFWFVSVGEELNFDHGEGKTKEDAIKALCLSLEEFYFDLKEDQDKLGKIMQEVWDYMQIIIKEK